MSVPILDLPGRNLGGDVVMTQLRNGTEYLVSVGKWILLLNLAMGWLTFWGNVARLHLSMGDLPAALITIGLFIGPLIAVSVWWIWRFVGEGMLERLVTGE